MKMDKQGPVTLDRKSLTPEIAVELATEFFQCPLCLDLSYQPAVTVCGHIFCVGCTQRAMNIAGSSECPSCKSRYDYLPHGCELIENLVLKLQPPEGMDPLLGVADLFSEDEKTAESSVNVSSEDMSCMMCKDLLYQSTVLHCGHVFCISCVPAGGETIECPDCRTVHPSDSLKPRRKLNQFIEKCFPNAYKSRKEKPRPFSGISSKREAMIHQKVLHTHVGVGCDSCGIYPIEGDRYLCRACENFDLCEQCTKISNPIQGRLGQHHLPGHDLELNNSFIFTEVSRVWRERDIEGHWDT
ncbi:hypothetical protein BS78_04G102800 [Paspalum vaginatum]|nr:hypothetical protein BS78_04G102800 [Paspalum vaginatum]